MIKLWQATMLQCQHNILFQKKLHANVEWGDSTKTCYKFIDNKKYSTGKTTDACSVMLFSWCCHQFALLQWRLSLGHRVWSWDCFSSWRRNRFWGWNQQFLSLWSQRQLCWWSNFCLGHVVITRIKVLGLNTNKFVLQNYDKKYPPQILPSTVTKQISWQLLLM